MSYSDTDSNVVFAYCKKRLRLSDDLSLWDAFLFSNVLYYKLLT